MNHILKNNINTIIQTLPEDSVFFSKYTENLKTILEHKGYTKGIEERLSKSKDRHGLLKAIFEQEKTFIYIVNNIYKKYPTFTVDKKIVEDYIFNDMTDISRFDKLMSKEEETISDNTKIDISVAETHKSWQYLEGKVSKAFSFDYSIWLEKFIKNGGKVKSYEYENINLRGFYKQIDHISIPSSVILSGSDHINIILNKKYTLDIGELGFSTLFHSDGTVSEELERPIYMFQNTIPSNLDEEDLIYLKKKNLCKRVTDTLFNLKDDLQKLERK